MSKSTHHIRSIINRCFAEFFFSFYYFQNKKVTFFFILRFSRLRKQLDLSDCFLILVETDTLLFSILSLVNVKKKKENLRIRKEIH